MRYGTDIARDVQEGRRGFDIARDLSGILSAPDGGSDADAWTDGSVRIPKDPAARAEWNAKYLERLQEVFVGKHPRRMLRMITVPIDAIHVRHELHSMPRFRMYRAMLAAGDHVPPIVVAYQPGSSRPWLLLDGHHRVEAATEEKRLVLPAVEVVERHLYDP